MTVTELSERVGLSKTPCAARLRRLAETGIILGYRPVLNGARLALVVTVSRKAHAVHQHLLQYLEFPSQTVDDYLEMEFAHPRIRVWPVSSSVLTTNVGSSNARRSSALDNLFLFAVVLGSIAIEIRCSGASMLSSKISSPSAQSVSPVAVNLVAMTAAISRRMRQLFSLICVHFEQFIKPLLLLLPGILRTLAQPLNKRECMSAAKSIILNFKSQRSKRL